jgi:hypothetical protein
VLTEAGVQRRARSRSQHDKLNPVDGPAGLLNGVGQTQACEHPHGVRRHPDALAHRPKLGRRLVDHGVDTPALQGNAEC